jgi:hypothetical protein
MMSRPLGLMTGRISGVGIHWKPAAMCQSHENRIVPSVDCVVLFVSTVPPKAASPSDSGAAVGVLPPLPDVLPRWIRMLSISLAASPTSDDCDNHRPCTATAASAGALISNKSCAAVAATSQMLPSTCVPYFISSNLHDCERAVHARTPLA